MIKKTVSLILLFTMTYYPVPLIAGSAQQEKKQISSINDVLEMTYVELFRLAPELSVPQPTLDSFKNFIEGRKEQEKKQLKDQKDQLEDAIDRAQESLEQLNRGGEDSVSVEERRHTLHCVIQKSRKELQDVKLALDKGLEIKYDNQKAKINILEEWPAQYQEIQRKKAANEAWERQFGDFRDVGFRGGVFEGQEEDVKKGRETIDELKRRDMLPPEVENEEIVSYMNSVGNKIARYSDLRVPLKLAVLKSEEINAFALPGGFLFVNTGLIDKAQNESQLAGVIAHEIAHVAARHGDRLMGKANIASIIFQAAQIAALIFSGGISSIATYYLLQYGFYGLGLILNLSLLGVSREYEIEADILGTQYLWNSNYDLTGFVSFFGDMAQEEGYIRGLSWFRTHPPFAKRMQRTFSEIVYLPDLEAPITNTEQFRNMKAELQKVLKAMEEKDREAPTLKRVYDCEDVSIPTPAS